MCPEIIAAKTGEFWSQLKKFPQESINDYYNHFHYLLDDLLEADEPISTKSVICHFFLLLALISNLFRIIELAIFHPNGTPRIGLCCWSTIPTLSTLKPS
jgi:hypothetical protein